jgi:hypothetical protein
MVQRYIWLIFIRIWFKEVVWGKYEGIIFRNALYGCVLWFGFKVRYHGYGLRLMLKEIFQEQFSKISFKVKVKVWKTMFHLSLNLCLSWRFCVNIKGKIYG